MAENGVNGRFVYEFGDFVVDPKDKTVFLAGRNLQLPPKEFDTLLLLIEHNGSVVTKSEMMSALWGETFVEEGNLPTYISRLRKVINLNGERVIETVPKLGYRFNAELRKTKLPAGDGVFVETLAAVERPESAKSRRGRGIFRIAVFGIAAISVIVIAAALYFQRREKPSPAAASIAVLPMRAMSPDDATRSLALGLTDAVISKIGTVHGLIVRPTSAVARFANSEEDSLQIGKRLNVDMVLEATLQQADGSWRINARLLRTATGEQVWAEKYDEAEASLFDVEDKLASKIANTLAFELTVAETRRLARKGTGNPEAYEKYLRGRYYQRQNTPEGLARSLELYQQATVLDPNFADAYAGIADADLIKYNFGISPPSEVISGARRSVKRALDLSPDLSDAYTSLAMIQFLADHDWASAESSLQRAISLNPNNTDAYHRYGYFLANMGQFDQALEKFEMARRVDPLSPIVQTGIGLTYLYARKFPEAIDQLQRVSADNPDFSMPVWFLATSYECSGDAEKGFDTSVKAMTIEGAADLANRLRIEREKNGVRSADELWLKELLKAEKEGKESPINIAWLYATLGDKENAITWLEKAYSSGDPTIAQIKFISKYDFLRDDPRFRELVGKLGF